MKDKFEVRKMVKMKLTTKTNRFSQIAIVIMIIIFIMNFFLSDCNLFWIFLSGGGNIVDYAGESYATVFENFQLYRLITYGYTQTAIWHLLANVLGLWYVSFYLEKKIGTIRFMLVFHIGLIAAGATLLVFYPSSFNYGASPAIFACLGMLANWLTQNKGLWDEYKSQKGYHFLMYYLVLSNILGVCTLVFHFLGFSVGFLLGFVVKEK